MSLLPRLPCRQLFIDSRHALPGSTSTSFSIEIPQGGLLRPLNNSIVASAKLRSHSCLFCWKLEVRFLRTSWKTSHRFIENGSVPIFLHFPPKIICFMHLKFAAKLPQTAAR